MITWDWIMVPVALAFAFLAVAIESLMRFVTDDKSHADISEGSVLWRIIMLTFFGLVVYYGSQAIMAYLYAG